MSHRNADIASGFAFAVAAGADFLVNHALSVVSIVGVAVGVVCQVVTVWLRYRESEANLGKLKTRLFREWEGQRDST